MKTRKLIVIALFSAFGISAEAQIVSSQSNQVIVTQEVKPQKPKTPWSGKWYLKAGVSMDIYAWDNYYADYDDLKNSGVGYKAGVGVKCPIGHNGAYWGAEAGIMSTLCEDPDSGKIADAKKDASLYAIPHVGWAFEASRNFYVAPYVGPYISYGFAEGTPQYGVSGGVDFWFNEKFAIGANYTRDLRIEGYSDSDYFHKIEVGVKIGI